MRLAAAIMGTVAGLALSAAAQGESPPAQVDEPFLHTASYLQHHPDQEQRLHGMEARKRGDGIKARRHFKTAARYADKLSQAALAEMLWLGEGGATDRPQAYAWMDLAAERGTRTLVLLRERYWSELTEQEQTDAISVGQTLYDQYSDLVAKPRLQAVMQRGRLQVTGSRLGRVGQMTLEINAGGGEVLRVSPTRYYADRYWQPEQYWQWQGEVLESLGREGTVGVGDLQSLPADN